MKKIMLFLLGTLVSILFLSCSDSRNMKEPYESSGDSGLDLLIQGYLTKEDALEDFTFLYDTIKSSYPHLNAYKRKYGVYGFDPDEGYNHYYSILDSLNDMISVKDYYDVAAQYLNDFFFFAHISIYDSLNAQYIYTLHDTFSQLGYNNSTAINQGIETFNNERSRTVYRHLGVTFGAAEDEKVYGSDLTFKFYDDYSAAYVNINSFHGVYIECDKEPLLEFYRSILNYENLIIDISNNGGGTLEYWRDLILLPNINEPLTGTFTPMFFMDSEIIRAYVETLGASYYPISEFDVTQYPDFNKEDLAELAYVIDTGGSVDNYLAEVEIPKEKLFQGNIYIITGPKTYSGANQFAAFAKATGFATVVGTNTSGGTGFLGYPINLTLPKSGLVLRFDSLYRIDERGKSIDEFGLPPDIYVSSPHLALRACFDDILSKASERKTDNSE